MGITLSGAIQVYYEARPDLSMRAHWETVCIWEFNKDYSLMRELGEDNRRPSFDAARVNDDWPGDSLYSDCLQVFTPEELPIYHSSYRYVAMCLAVNSLLHNKYRIRILFWRD